MGPILAPLIYLALMFGDFVFVSIKHGEPKDNYNIGEVFIEAGICIPLLYWGGFFDRLLERLSP